MLEACCKPGGLRSSFSHCIALIDALAKLLRTEDLEFLNSKSFGLVKLLTVAKISTCHTCIFFARYVNFPQADTKTNHCAFSLISDNNFIAIRTSIYSHFVIIAKRYCYPRLASCCTLHR